jgi:hypothetical protein
LFTCGDYEGVKTIVSFGVKESRIMSRNLHIYFCNVKRFLPAGVIPQITGGRTSALPWQKMASDNGSPLVVNGEFYDVFDEKSSWYGSRLGSRANSSRQVFKFSQTSPGLRFFSVRSVVSERDLVQIMLRGRVRQHAIAQLTL